MVIDHEALDGLRQWLRHNTKSPADAGLLLCAALVALQEDYSLYERDNFADDVATIIRSAQVSIEKTN